MCIYVAAVVSANANAVTLECLPINFMKSLDSESRNAGANPGSAADSTQPGKANPDSAAIAASLRAADGNKSEAARMLGISRMTLWRKIREMG